MFPLFFFLSWRKSIPPHWLHPSAEICLYTTYKIKSLFFSLAAQVNPCLHLLVSFLSIIRFLPQSLNQSIMHQASVTTSLETVHNAIHGYLIPHPRNLILFFKRFTHIYSLYSRSSLDVRDATLCLVILSLLFYIPSCWCFPRSLINTSSLDYTQSGPTNPLLWMSIGSSEHNSFPIPLTQNLKPETRKLLLSTYFTKTTNFTHYVLLKYLPFLFIPVLF